MKASSEELWSRYLAGIYGPFCAGRGMVSSKTHILRGTLNFLKSSVGEGIVASICTLPEDGSFHFHIDVGGDTSELYVSCRLPYAALLALKSMDELGAEESDDSLLKPVAANSQAFVPLRQLLREFGIILLEAGDLLKRVPSRWGLNPDGLRFVDMTIPYDDDYSSFETYHEGKDETGSLVQVLDMYLECSVGHPHPASHGLSEYRKGISQDGFSALADELETLGRGVTSTWFGSSWCFEIVESGCVTELWISGTLPYVFMRARRRDFGDWDAPVSEELATLVASLPVLALSWEDLVLESAYRIDQDSRKMTYFEMLFTAGRPFFVPE